jgi:hypothetical protein
MKTFALIHFQDRKPLKKRYETASKAMYDHLDMGCILVELYNEKGNLLSSWKKKTN